VSVKVCVVDDPVALAEAASDILAQQVVQHPGSVLGLATGSTPEQTYALWVERLLDRRVPVDRLTTFNLDEYVGVPPAAPTSYHSYMRQQVFDRLGLAAQQWHLPDGMAVDLVEACASYERSIQAAGGIDLQLLGIGRNGHIGFNEPGSDHAGRTSVVELAEQTRIDNQRFFGETPVPSLAVTMGIGTILESRKILLIASGSSKASAVAACARGPISIDCPASALQRHADVTLLVDRAAAEGLRP
jgi:glucosamine-6-phosphate deaminase